MFGCTKLTILGHVVSGDTISADPYKLSAFQKLSVPTTGQQLKGFLGTACYLRDYIPLFSRIAAPLQQISKRKGLLLFGPLSVNKLSTHSRKCFAPSWSSLTLITNFALPLMQAI